MRTIFSFTGFLFLLLLLPGCSKKEEISPDKAESFDIISWVKPIEFGNEAITVYDLTKKADDGFLASGMISYSGNSLNQGFVINLNSRGDTIWCKKIKIEDYPNNVALYAIQKSDSEIIIAGLCSYVSFKKHRFVAWLDSEGNVTKHLLFPISDNEVVDDCKIIPLENGDFYYAVREEMSWQNIH